MRSIFRAKRLAPAMVSAAYAVEAEGGESGAVGIRKDEKVGVVGVVGGDGEEGEGLVRGGASISRAGRWWCFLECASLRIHHLRGLIEEFEEEEMLRKSDG